MKRALSFAISNVLLATFSEAALAKDKSVTRDAREKVARKACITGDFRKGVDILADLFIETRDYTYVFNQGRCFQQHHRWEEALDRFDEYLRKATGIPSDEVAEVRSTSRTAGPIWSQPNQPRLSPRPRRRLRPFLPGRSPASPGAPPPRRSRRPRLRCR